MNVIQIGAAFQVQSASPEERADKFGLFRTSVVAFRLRTRRLDVEPHAGGFSLKTVFRGSERYEFGDRRILVRQDEVLMVAPDRFYGSTIRSAEDTDSFSLFFPPSWLAQSIATGTGHGIQRLVQTGLPALGLAAQPRLSAALRGLALALDAGGDPLFAQQHLAEVEAAVFAGGDELGPVLRRISVRNPARRAELLRRVLRARDRLHASLADELSLADLAEIAHLSEFHLLRIFRQAFGVTPACYRQRLRMELAFRLATQTRQPVSAIAVTCGYQDHSAFARAFRRHFGRSPGSFRAGQ
jgi:AraC-like DNA-binding protein